VENRIVSVDSGAATYTYDAEGKRVEKNVGGALVDYVYDSSGRVLWDTVGTIIEHREDYGAGLHVTTALTNSNNTGGNLYFHHSDWLGTERVRTDITGASCETIASLPFGDNQTISGTCGDVDAHHFTGKERDSESGLDNFGARYNASTMGRFMSPDPKILSIRHIINPQKWNKYAYTINNPLRYFDPNGMEEIEVQLRSFIQANTRTDPRGRIFAGDSRGFSSAPNASSRTSITVRIETDASKRPGNPIISITPGSAGETRQLEANGNIVNRATATTGLPTVTGSRDANGNAVLNFQENTKNPLEPQSVTPPISANLTTTLTQNGLSADTTGTVSGSPSFELNIGSTNVPLQSEPSSDAGFAAGLFVPLPIQNQTPLPPPPPSPPACVTDKEKPCQ
jgi:RHS repeat-associated protein